MTATNGLQYALKIDLPQYLARRHGALRQFVAELLVDSLGGEHFSAYFEKRSHYQAAARQDLLPLLVYEAVSQKSYRDVIPLTAAWALYLAGAHLLDDAQDNGSQYQDAKPLPSHFTSAVVALAAANIALAQQEVGSDKLLEVLAVMGEVTINGAVAQHDEQVRGRGWSKQDYFYNIASKSASIIAAGIWMGAVLTVEDEQTLMILQEFGLALGMTMQIADDCLDLAEDLANGTYTLPVIEALAMTDHPEYGDLNQLLSRQPLCQDDLDAVLKILNRMDVVSACRRLARAYQVQAGAALSLFPDLAPFFSDYVSVEA
jgi:geranylgeranyl pyrophosphate synthase